MNPAYDSALTIKAQASVYSKTTQSHDLLQVFRPEGVFNVRRGMVRPERSKAKQEKPITPSIPTGEKMRDASSQRGARRRKLKRPEVLTGNGCGT
jgi:hypothetical protein